MQHEVAKFAAHEWAIRIDDATPKVLLMASGGKELDKIIPYGGFETQYPFQSLFQEIGKTEKVRSRRKSQG